MTGNKFLLHILKFCDKISQIYFKNGAIKSLSMTFLVPEQRRRGHLLRRISLVFVFSTRLQHVFSTQIGDFVNIPPQQHNGGEEQQSEHEKQGAVPVSWGRAGFVPDDSVSFASTSGSRSSKSSSSSKKKQVPPEQAVPTGYNGPTQAEKNAVKAGYDREESDVYLRPAHVYMNPEMAHPFLHFMYTAEAGTAPESESGGGSCCLGRRGMIMMAEEGVGGGDHGVTRLGA